MNRSISPEEALSMEKKMTPPQVCVAMASESDYLACADALGKINRVIIVAWKGCPFTNAIVNRFKTRQLQELNGKYEIVPTVMEVNSTDMYGNLMDAFTKTYRIQKQGDKKGTPSVQNRQGFLTTGRVSANGEPLPNAFEFPQVLWQRHLPNHEQKIDGMIWSLGMDDSLLNSIISTQKEDDFLQQMVLTIPKSAVSVRHPVGKGGDRDRDRDTSLSLPTSKSELAKMIRDNNNLLFAYRSGCAYSSRAREILRASGIPFVECTLQWGDNSDSFKSMMKDATSSNYGGTMPVYFRRHVYFGGCSDIEKAQQQDTLS